MKIFTKLTIILTLLLLNLSACSDQSVMKISEYVRKIVNVDQTPVERQSIGNCWIYANASWAESMHKRATGQDFDISQSYWTYMDWYTKILEGNTKVEDGKVIISTGGYFSYAQKIIRNYGLMEETKFVKSDSDSERSDRQASALDFINKELNEGGRLYDFNGIDKALVREVLDEAWELDENVKTQLTKVFGNNLENVLTVYASERLDGTDIIHPVSFTAYYNKKKRTLLDAINSWQPVSYSAYNSKTLLKRVRKALHDREPVLISWMVDFNAFEEDIDSPLYGSFNSKTLYKKGEIGRQGGHMTVLEDYEAKIFHKQVIFEDSGFVADKDWHHVGTSLNLTAGEKIVISGNGDADLYIKKGSSPTEKDYDCRPYVNGSDEQCKIKEDGEYFVAISGYKAADFKLRVESNEKIQELVRAGETLNPGKINEKKKLEKLLDDDSEIVFFRTKNSWGGAQRPDLAYAPHSEKGYHDLYMDYLDAPFKTEENCEDGLESESCGENAKLALKSFVLPPEFFYDGEEE